jgi:hypothetical protein
MTLILMMQFDRALILTGLMEPALLRLNVCGESIVVETHFRTSFKTNARHTVGIGKSPSLRQQRNNSPPCSQKLI